MRIDGVRDLAELELKVMARELCNIKTRLENPELFIPDPKKFANLRPISEIRAYLEQNYSAFVCTGLYNECLRYLNRLKDFRIGD